MTSRSVFFYLVAGGIATACHYCLTIASVEYFSVDPLLASSAGFSLGATVKYLMNYFLAFQSKERHVQALPRYAVTLIVLFLANGALFWLMHNAGHLHYLLSQVITTILLIPIGYALSLLWVFRS